MIKKRFLVIFLLVIIMGGVGVTQARASTDNSALIRMLLEQVAILQAQLTKMKAGENQISQAGTAPILTSFPIATKFWSKSILPANIPQNSYRAYYFNTNEPEKHLTTKTVPKVTVSYIYDEIGIPSEDFGGYWIGNITMPVSGNYVISTDESWSESQVIIDERLVKNQSKDSVTIYLKKGTYKVEVEYKNNWHTTGFSMNLLPVKKQWKLGDLSNELKKIADSAKNTYVSIYESENENREVTLDLSDNKDTGILFLSSYSQINWIIKNPRSIDVVVVSSFKKGTVVDGLPSHVPVYFLEENEMNLLPPEHSLEVDCGSYKNIKNLCDYTNQLKRIDDAVIGLTGKKIDTFTGLTSADFVKVPGIILTNTLRKQIYDSYDDFQKEIEEEQNQ